MFQTLKGSEKHQATVLIRHAVKFGRILMADHYRGESLNGYEVVPGLALCRLAKIVSDYFHYFLQKFALVLQKGSASLTPYILLFFSAVIKFNVKIKRL